MANCLCTHAKDCCVYFPSCEATIEMTTVITLEWAHKLCVMRVHTLICFLHDPWLKMNNKAIFTRQLHVSLTLFTSFWWRYNRLYNALQLWRKHAKNRDKISTVSMMILAAGRVRNVYSMCGRRWRKKLNYVRLIELCGVPFWIDIVSARICSDLMIISMIMIVMIMIMMIMIIMIMTRVMIIWLITFYIYLNASQHDNILFSLYPPLQRSWKGVYWFTLFSCLKYCFIFT